MGGSSVVPGEVGGRGLWLLKLVWWSELCGRLVKGVCGDWGWW